MKIVNFTLVSFSLLPGFLMAQDGVTFDDDFNLWNIQKGNIATVFVDKAYVRAGAGLHTKVVDSLRLGAVINIVSAAIKGSTVKNFYAPWYQITYRREGELKEGYIWLGLLALGKQVDKDGLQYLYGFDRFIRNTNEQESDYLLTTVKLLNSQDSLLASQSYPFVFSGQLSSQSKLLSGMGLDKVKNILRIAFLSDACAVPTEYNYVAWTGQRLAMLPNRYVVSDAGVFYYEEKILFPSEHRKNNQIIYKYIEEGEAKDDGSEEPNYSISKREEHYRWDGKEFIKVELTQ